MSNQQPLREESGNDLRDMPRNFYPEIYQEPVGETGNLMRVCRHEFLGKTIELGYAAFDTPEAIARIPKNDLALRQSVWIVREMLRLGDPAADQFLQGCLDPRWMCAVSHTAGNTAARASSPLEPAK